MNLTGININTSTWSTYLCFCQKNRFRVKLQMFGDWSIIGISVCIQGSER